MYTLLLMTYLKAQFKEERNDIKGDLGVRGHCDGNKL